jgi:uncharacterized protein YbjT (DUF2867 family)
MPEVLVIGATGKVGRHLVDELVSRGVAVRAATRVPGPAGPLVTPVRFDWDDPDTHADAVAGIDTVYLIAPSFVVDPTPVTGPFLQTAAAAGVRRVVTQTAMGIEHAVGTGLHALEQQVMATVPSWTMIRPNWFAQNFDEGAYRFEIAATRGFAAPAGDAPVSFVDTRDVAAVAAAALLGDPGDWAGREVAPTGPRPVTFAESAEIVSHAWGETVEYRDCTPEAGRAALVAAGLPGDYADFMMGIYAMLRGGLLGAVTDDVEAVTGRPARTLEQYAADATPPWRRGAGGG